MILYRLAKWMEKRMRLVRLISECEGDPTVYIQQKKQVERQMIWETRKWLTPGTEAYAALPDLSRSALPGSGVLFHAPLEWPHRRTVQDEYDDYFGGSASDESDDEKETADLASMLASIRNQPDDRRWKVFFEELEIGSASCGDLQPRQPLPEQAVLYDGEQWMKPPH